MLTAASNKRITNRAPSSYLKDVKAALGDQLSAVLKSNFISDRAFQAALEDDYDEHLKERAITIHAAISVLTGWKP
jgi:hypothetical protein